MVLKKKEIIAASLVVLIGVAGYLNWSYQDTIRVQDGESYVETGKKLGEAQYVSSDTVAEGNVISQDVQGGTTVSSGTQVQLTVSGTAPASDTDTIPVPDVLGALEADATATLTRSGFTVTKADGYSDTIEKGKVISQNPVVPVQPQALP